MATRDDALDTIDAVRASAGSTPLAPEAIAADRVEAIVNSLDRTVLYRMIQPRSPSAREPDGGARLVYISRNIERIFGIGRDDALADAALWYGLIEPSTQMNVLSAQQRAFRAGGRIQMDVPFLIRDGDVKGRRIFHINATSEALPDGSTAWNGSVADVTQTAERARLMEVVDVSPDLIGTVDASGKIVYLNQAGHEMLGMEWSSDPDARIEEIGIDTLHPPDMRDLYWNEIVPTVKKHEVWSGDTEIVDRKGRRIPVSQVVVAHRGPSTRKGRPGPITHLSTIVRDMSARAELETRLRAARRASEIARDAAEMARAHAENMTHEVNHRVKNLFSLVPAIVQLSARSTADVQTLVVKVRERIAALVRSHDLTLNENGELTGVGLSGLLEAVLAPYCEADDHRARLCGPSVQINAADGNALSLVLHELATNAAKYGALSTADATLHISWDVASREPDAVGEMDTRWRELSLVWQESSTGSPPLPIRAPTRSGSGTMLLDRLIAAQRGTVDREWGSDGLTVRIALPIHGARRRKGATG